MRLKEDFFDSDEIKIIESQPNGYMYSNILLKLYLKSLKRNGKLMVTDFIPYTLESLSKVLYRYRT
ncbi:phage replisome organizer N-terminal domain-containing protein [Clostridium beijerinckii]|uniref:phage replisome organizer N-terminal domain-containing protein n=1 Tax=Clostridium beijerinckii TaxID=1520 RepID=UPI003C2DAAD4